MGLMLVLSATAGADGAGSKAVAAREASEMAKAGRYRDKNDGATQGNGPEVVVDASGWIVQFEAAPSGGSTGWAADVDLKPLVALSHLEVVTYHRHQLDLAPLVGLPRLEVLTLDDCEVKSWAVVARLRSLETLKVRGRTPSPEELAVIAALPSLRWLEVDGLTSLAPLAGAKSLRVLHLGNSPALTSLAGIEGLTELEEIQGQQTGIRDPGPALGLPRLQTLYLDYSVKLPASFFNHAPAIEGDLRRWRSGTPDMLLAASVKSHRVDELQRALARKAPIAPNVFCAEQNCLVESLQDPHRPGLDLLIAAATPEVLAQPLRGGFTPLSLMLAKYCGKGECAPFAAAMVKRGSSTQARDDRQLTAQQLACLSGNAELEAALGKMEGSGKYAVGQRVRLHHQWAADGTVLRQCGDGYAVQSDQDAFMGGKIVLAREDRVLIETSKPADAKPIFTVSPSSSSAPSSNSSPEYIVPPSSSMGRQPGSPSYRAKRCLEDCSANCRSEWNKPNQGNNDYLRSVCVQTCENNCRD